MVVSIRVWMSRTTQIASAPAKAVLGVVLLAGQEGIIRCLIQTRYPDELAANNSAPSF